MTADPLFFLHLSQIDRVWWIWQQKFKSHRQAYSGPESSKTTARASLDDTLAFQGLGPDVDVSEVMDTESVLLCYRYDRIDLGDVGLEPCKRSSCHFEAD